MRCESGMVYEQDIEITVDDGRTIVFRRITIERDNPTKKGEMQVHALTNLPKIVSALKVTTAYRNRWKIETAFQDVTVTLRCELNTLGYPDAALFGFCIALMIYSVMSVIQAALRGSQTKMRKIDRNISL